MYGGDEVLWTVCGISLEVNGSEVARMILKKLGVVRRIGSLVDVTIFFFFFFIVT